MPDLSSKSPTPLGLALGRLPSGLYILTARHGAQATGMLASWVQQAGFDPPMLTVAVNQDRYIGDWMAETGRFTLNQIQTGQKALIRHFARGFAAEAHAFDGLTLREEVHASGPVLADALAYLDCKVVGEIASGDHRIFLGRVESGSLLIPDGEPMVHVRHYGFHY